MTEHDDNTTPFTGITFTCTECGQGLQVPVTHEDGGDLSHAKSHIRSCDHAARALGTEAELIEGVWVESDLAGTGEAVFIGEALPLQPGAVLLPCDPEECDK